MSLSDVTPTIKDGGLGVASQGGGQIVAALGCCVKGTNNVVQGVGSIAAVRSLIGVGPLAEACALKIAAGCKEVRFARANPSTYGTASGVTHTGPGVGTVTPAPAPHAPILGKITTGGILGTSQIAFSVDGGDYGTPVPTAATVVIPGTFCTWAMPAGTYVLNEIYTAAVDNTLITQSGAGPLPTRTASYVDGYDVRVTIMQGGGLGVGTFKYSIDGGDNYSGETQIPANGRFGISGTGLMMTFAGTQTALDTFAFTTTGPSYNTAEATAALDALIADAADWTHVHIVGAPSNAAGAASLAAAIDAKLVTAAGSFNKYRAAITECPQVEADSTIGPAFASLDCKRTMTVVGDGEVISQYTGKQDRRNMACVLSAKAGVIEARRSIARVKDGGLPFMGVNSSGVAIYRDEAATPGLDNYRLTTVRTRQKKAGVYCNIDRTLATAGSDFGFWPRRRVMDEACKASYAALLDEVADDVAVNPTTGFIDEGEAQLIEKAVLRAIEAQLRGQISKARVTVDRSNNILQTNTIIVEVGIQPRAVAYFITETIQFIPTALAA